MIVGSPGGGSSESDDALLPLAGGVPMWRWRFLRSPSLRAVHRAGTGAETNLSSRQSQFEQPAWSSDGWDRQQEMRVSCEASLADEFGSEIDAATAMRVLTAAAATG